MSKATALKSSTPRGEARRRTPPAKRSSEWTLAERRKKIGAFCDEVDRYWSDKPKTNSVECLVTQRRTQA